MKKVLILVMCLLMIIVMTACTNTEVIDVGIMRSYMVYIDKETGVNYMVYDDGKSGGICPRYNADGTLYISEVE